MSSIEEAIVNRTLNDTAIKALIDSRLFPLLTPETALLPAIAYQKISSPRTRSQSGASNLARSRVQLTLVATTYVEVKKLEQAVRACWESYRGTILGVRFDGVFVEDVSDSEDSGAPVVRVELSCWHSEG